MLILNFGRPCGMNGALYLSAMDITGGRSQLNPAGATYGEIGTLLFCLGQPYLGLIYPLIASPMSL